MGKKRPHKRPLFEPGEYVSPVSFALDKVLDRVAERMMDTIVEIYNHMDDSDKDAFTLEDAEDMVEDQIRMDKEAGREPLAYDPQFFYDTIVELMEQDVE